MTAIHPQKKVYMDSIQNLQVILGHKIHGNDLKPISKAHSRSSGSLLPSLSSLTFNFSV